MKANAANTSGRQGSFKKRITSSVSTILATPINTSAADAAAKAAADAAAKAAADAAAKAAAKAKLQSEVNAAIAAAETQYQNELKIAQDKLAATKALWLAKLNG
jgi:membrane protein involved in colicin uptake